MLFGALYGVLYSFYLAIKNKKLFLRKMLTIFKSRKIKLLIILIPIIYFISILILSRIDFELKIILYAILTLLFLLTFLFIFLKIVELSCMIKRKSIKEVTEGEWIADDKIKKKYKISDLGINSEQIRLLKQEGINNILIKEGMPFTPTFLIAVIISMIVGSLIPI